MGVDAGTGGTLSQGLIAWYACEQASGTTTLPDQSGNNNATLGSNGTGGASGYSFSTGKVNNALTLNGASKGYVALPAGILADACEATVATWVYLNSNPNWQRVWDFGKDEKVYMFLTTNSYTHLLRFAITLGGNTEEHGLTAGSTLPLNEWKHVAVVLGPSGGILYVDGQPVATDPDLALRPADLGSTPNNYIGRSQFSADPYLDGRIDEFRVYDRALSPLEIQALYAGP